jgi:hypothetical protein
MKKSNPKTTLTAEALFAACGAAEFSFDEILAIATGTTHSELWQTFSDYRCQASRFLTWIARRAKKGAPPIVLKPEFQAAVQAALRHVGAASIDELENPQFFILGRVLREWTRPKSTYAPPTIQARSDAKVRAQVRELVALDHDYRRMQAAAEQLRELTQSHPHLFKSLDPPVLK